MITGRFTKVSVPQVAHGAEIKATVGYSAMNPIGSFWDHWKVFIVADSPGVFRMVLDGISPGTIVRADRVEETRSYNLGRMPDREIAITFTLWAHEDPSYIWSWGDYQAAMEGWSSAITHLASEYKFISPTEAPPEPPTPPEFSGLITSVLPSQIQAGKPLDLSISFNAYADSLLQQINGWWTRVTATLDSLGDSDTQFHTGRDGSRVGQELRLGAMPKRNLTGKVALEAGKGKLLPMQQPDTWYPIDSKSISVEVKVSPTPTPPDGNGVPPITCSIDADCPEGYECEDGKCVKKEEDWMKWLPWIAVGGAVLLLTREKTKTGE